MSVQTLSGHVRKDTGREDKDKDKVKNEYKILKDLNPHTGEMDRGSNILMDNWLKKSAAPIRPAARTYLHLSSFVSILLNINLFYLLRKQTESFFFVFFDV